MINKVPKLSPLMEKLVCPHNINQAWRRFDRDQTIWEPGVRINSIQRDIPYHLMTLAQHLAQDEYKPARVRRFTLKKASGKERNIAALCLRDKVAQRALLQVLEPLAEKEMHSDSFGYRPGRNTEMAYARVRTYLSEGFVWLVHVDIHQFFDRIPLRRLKRWIKKRLKDPALGQILNRFIDCHATTPGRIWRKARGVPQGGILSPLLGNWYLSQLDATLSKNKLRFVRYADDIMLCCRTEPQAKQALNLLNKAVKKLGLALNPEKTQVERASHRVIWLGRPLPRQRNG